MEKTPHASSASGFLLSAAAFIIVIAGMREAQPILVPFLLSVFIAVIALPPLVFLQHRRIPTGVALLLVVSGVVGLGALLGILVGNAVDKFSAQLPLYQEKLQVQLSGLLGWLQGQGIEVSEEAARKFIDPGKVMKMAGQGLTSLGSMLTNAFLILLTVIFILLEASTFPLKLQSVLSDPKTSMAHMGRFTDNIQRYMAIKTATSLLTGLVVGLWLWVLGVDFPLLWGVLAFLLNFVPNIGSIIAAIPALLLCLVQLGPGTTLWAAAGYLVVNNVVGNVIEPRFMGRGLGLSTLVVFLSLVFWGWVLGPVGMFLSVPLTMAVKIALDSNEGTRWIAVLLDSDVKAPASGDEAPRPLRLHLPRFGGRKPAKDRDNSG